MSPNARRTRRGRPPNYVKDSNAHEVVGLSPLPVRNKAGEVFKFRYYATYSKPRKYFGYDLEQAIAAFRRWQSEQAETTVELHQTMRFDAGLKRIMKTKNPNWVEKETYTQKRTVDEAVFWKQVAEVFATPEGRRKAAKLTGYSLIRQLDEPDLFPRSLSLREIEPLFIDTLKNNNEKQKAENYWQEFCKAVAVTNVHEVTRDNLVTYRAFIESLNVSPRTVKNRYDTIGQILSTARDRRENHTEVIDKLRDSFRIICRKTAPIVPKGKATPIDPKDFAAMLNVADTKWEAILYLLLNCGLHPGELTNLHLDDLDLRKGHLIDHRNKTTQQRCSMLWRETVDAVQSYVAEYKPNGLLFVNQAGKRHPTGEFGKQFYSKVRNPAGVDRVTPEWFRDSGTTAASRKGVSLGALKVWLGQSRQDVDSYDHVEPLHTQPVVDAIYAEYIGCYRDFHLSEPLPRLKPG